MPKVSIIVSVYNQEKYLRQCLDSIQNQTLKDFECIIVNDGSTDKSLEIAQKYTKSDQRFKIVDKENEGYGKALNIGINVAIGEYIGMVDPDDWIDPEMYETLYNKAKELDLDMIKSDFYRALTNSSTQYAKLITNKRSNSLYDKILNLENNPTCLDFGVPNWNGLYKLSWLNKYNIRHNETPGASYQDTGFWILTTYFAKRFMVISKAFYHYRFEIETGSMCSRGKVFSMPSEWDFINTRLKLNWYDTTKEYIKTLWKKYYIDSLWGFQRAQGLKMKLASLFKFAQDFKDCPITEIGLTKDEIKKLKLIINDPITFFTQYTKSGQAANQVILNIKD